MKKADIPFGAKSAVIFDMDGLIIDSEPFWVKADLEFFQRRNKKYSVRIHQKIMGRGHREIIDDWKKEYEFIGDTDDLINERKQLFYDQFFKNILLMDGAEIVIRELYKKGFSLGIATSGHSQKTVKEMLEKLSLNEFFSAIISADEVEKSKPEPDIFLKAAAKLQKEPSVCLVMEDSPNGVKAGKAAGMRVFGINNNPKLLKQLQAAGADKVYSSLTEVNIYENR